MLLSECCTSTHMLYSKITAAKPYQQTVTEKTIGYFVFHVIRLHEKLPNMLKIAGKCCPTASRCDLRLTMEVMHTANDTASYCCH